jgi:hypothetical protein
MEGDKTFFKEEEQAAHSTAGSEKLPSEQGETGQTEPDGRYTHVQLKYESRI